MISPASERSELAGAEERRRQPAVFRPGELLCGPLAGLLGSGEDASVRAYPPLSDYPECVAACSAVSHTSGYRCPL